MHDYHPHRQMCGTTPHHPTLSMADRINKLTGKHSGKPFEHWKWHHEREIKAMEDGEWMPTLKLLIDIRREAMVEHGIVPEDTPGQDCNLAKKVFSQKFKIESADRETVHDRTELEENCVRCHIVRMLKGIYHEHLNLLVSGLKKVPKVSDHSLPSLVSIDYPIGVALTRWLPDSVRGGIAPVDEAKVGAKKDVGKSQETQGKAKTSVIDDFKPHQLVALSLSTVLNSTSILDRIEYVSIYIYVQPFPFPPNNNILLEKEFWRRLTPAVNSGHQRYSCRTSLPMKLLSVGHR